MPNVRKDWGSCLVDGCAGRDDYRSAQLCRRHYNLRRSCWSRHGDDCRCWDTVPEVRPTACTHAGCGKPVRSKGLCALHYDRVIRGRPVEPAVLRCSACGEGVVAWSRTRLCQRCYQRAWKTKERHAINNNRTRAKKAGAEMLAYTETDIRRLLDKPCAYCHSTKDVEVDHVVPLSRGGRDAIGNLVPCCATCNRKKSDMLVSEWRYRREKAA